MNRRIFAPATLAAVVALAACNETRSIFTDPATANAYGYQLQVAATNLPRGSVKFLYPRNTADPTLDQVTVTLQGVDSLKTGYYQAWIGDSLGTSWKPATGLLTGVRQDTILDAIGNLTNGPAVPLNFGQVSAIQNGGPRTVYTWVFTRASASLLASDSIQTFMITIEDAPGATTPHPSRRPLWARRGDGSAAAAAGNGPSRTASLRFGNYAPIALNEYLYSATPARGRGYFVQGELLVSDSTLARPPIGYYYAIWLTGAFYGSNLVQQDTLYLGAQRSPYPRRDQLSEFDADTAITDPLVVIPQFPVKPGDATAGSILAGSVRVNADTVAIPSGEKMGRTASRPSQGFLQSWVTLEAKTAARGRMGPARVLLGTVPYVIYSGQF